MGISAGVTAYRQTEAETVSPIEAVIMHCDTLARDLKLVVAAIHAGDIEERVNQSNHALLVLQALELMLDFDNGGSTAKELAKVYSHVRSKLIESQIKQDPAIVEQQLDFVLQLRQAWQQALTPATNPLPAATPNAQTAAPAVTSQPYACMGEEVRSCSWSA